MNVSVVDVVLGSLVAGLAGWALVQTGSAKPEGGCGGGCGPTSCGPAKEPGAEDELVRIGGRADGGEPR